MDMDKGNTALSVADLGRALSYFNHEFRAGTPLTSEHVAEGLAYGRSSADQATLAYARDLRANMSDAECAGIVGRAEYLRATETVGDYGFLYD